MLITNSRSVAILILVMMMAPASVGAKSTLESKQLETLVGSESAFRRAVAAHRRGDLATAAEAYEAAIGGDSGFVEAMANLARVEVSRGHLEAAAEWIDRAESSHREYPGVHAARGLLALRRGDAALAVEALSEAHALSPDDVEVLTNLGAALLTRGFMAEAIEVSERAQRLDPRHAAASFNLGLAHDRLGKSEPAQYHYQRFLDLSHSEDPDRLRVEARLAEFIPREPLPPESSPLSHSSVGPAAAAPQGDLHD